MEWTDDMSVRLARRTSALGLVEYLRAATPAVSRREILTVLTERFGLSFDDARLAMDRVAGGMVRARSGNPANEPDELRDPLAWMSYRVELGLPVEDDGGAPSPHERTTAEALLEQARRGGPTQGTPDVGVALEVARLAIESQEPGRTRYFLLMEAATSVSSAAEACIDRLGVNPCAMEGSQEWVDAAALAGAARGITAQFAAQPDPVLEERGLALVGRIVTRLMGQSHALVGRAMLDSARCALRNGSPDAAAGYAQAVIADFTRLLDQFHEESPVDEDVIALEYLLAAVELVAEVSGSTADLDDLHMRTLSLISRAGQSD